MKAENCRIKIREKAKELQHTHRKERWVTGNRLLQRPRERIREEGNTGKPRKCLKSTESKRHPGKTSNR